MNKKRAAGGASGKRAAAPTRSAPPAGAFEIGGTFVPAGRTKSVGIPAMRLPTQTMLELGVRVVNGLRPGPRLWLTAAIHGDELNGIEIIRRVVGGLDPMRLRGVLVAVPVVNLFGFIQESRYLPDRRDLNRSFPGSVRGSLASRLAALLLREVVDRCDAGIDLHTAATGRNNLPQIRADLKNEGTRRLALAFGAPVALHASVRDGSLRQAAALRGMPTLLFEGGESQRFDEGAIRVGRDGVLRVMKTLDMIEDDIPAAEDACVELERSSWIRARRSGLLRLEVAEGDRVSARQRLGVISDPLGENPRVVHAPFRGIVIGKATNPLVHLGDGIVHLGELP